MRVLIVDQHPLCRSALSDLLCSSVGLERAGVVEAESLEQALDRLAAGPAELVIADVSTCDGLGAMWPKRLVEAADPASVMVLDHAYEPNMSDWARSSGARGYVARTSKADLVAAAIRLVLAGGTFFQSEVPSKGQETAVRRIKLSPRQIEVLTQLEKGRTNKEIAATLGISVATVKLHVQAILKAIGAKNRTEAATLARGRR